MPVGTKNKEELNALRYNISDHYNLMEKLGFGTYSQVRRGIHKKSEEIYAVKISKGQTSGNFLKNEAEILKQLNSDFIPKFHEFQTDSFSNKSYLVMEYVKGTSLDKFIEENGALSEEESLRILKQLISAVKELHSNGYAHRDIKPQNIIITEDKNLKLIDFNISKRMKSGSESDDEECKFKSIFFTQISSPKYSAPELSLQECYSESIDIWGIGLAFAEMLFNISNESLQELKEGLSDVLVELNSTNKISEETLSWLVTMVSANPKLRPSIFELSEHFC
uniref:Protein kinase domain-containing protein n=1 Tax=Euplotes crassus TaxID=5936 RepID=A0A7S3KWC2_EUPCR